MKGEFEFIADIRSKFPAPEGIAGIGDDCAIIPQKNGLEMLVSTDMLVEGRHFLLDDISPRDLGWKSAAVNFSDIAAMGGRPLGSLLALALPRNLPRGWAESYMEGYREISEQYGFPLLGGDTTGSETGVCICVTVLGEAPLGGSRRRSAAREGDLVCVTGCLGDSAAGLQAILRHLPDGGDVAVLKQRHHRPLPRIREGMELAASTGVHAMMDISDGIGSDLRHILEESGVGAEIDVAQLPLSGEMLRFCGAQGLDATELALCGGEDYELLFTVAADAEDELKIQHYKIGRITAGTELIWKGTDKDYMGYRHF